MPGVECCWLNRAGPGHALQLQDRLAVGLSHVVRRDVRTFSTSDSDTVCVCVCVCV